MEDSHRESRFLKINNETVLENFLSHTVHQHFLVAVYYYFEQSSYSRETLETLSTFPDVFLIGHTTADIFLPFIKQKLNNSDFFSKISNSSALPNGGLAVFSLGEYSERITNFIVFDSLNVTEIMIE